MTLGDHDGNNQNLNNNINKSTANGGNNENISKSLLNNSNKTNII